MSNETPVVAIVGAGTIGASWAALFLSRGSQVHVCDPAPAAETSVRRFVDSAWPTLQALGPVEDGWSARLRFFADVEPAVATAFLIQENVPERLSLKHEMYRRIEPAMRQDAILATSSSGFLLRDLQQGWVGPGRIIIGHPFNPPHLIPLVEVLGNDRTMPGVLETAERFYQGNGKVTIRVHKEMPGHVANRLQAALWREAIYLVTEGVVSVSDLDKAVTAGPGLRWAVMGPHMLFNLGGGPQGMQGFCERYRESFHTWWGSLGAPALSREVGQQLARGVADEQAGRGLTALASERDQKIVAALRALRSVPL
jgi:carnitine 3-dehydrogenase